MKVNNRLRLKWNCLKSVYEYEQYNEGITRRRFDKRFISTQISPKPRGYWSSLENQKHFLDELQNKLKIESLIGNYNKLSVSEIKKHGGSGLLKIYNSNLHQLLSTIYPSLSSSHKNRTKKNYWQDISIRRDFMDNLFSILNFTSFEHWKSISLEIIKKYGGNGLLAFYHNNISELLEDIYPNYAWESPIKKGKKYWKNISSQKNFIHNLFNDLKIQSPFDYQKVTKNQIIDYGGRGLLSYYKNNLHGLFSNLFSTNGSNDNENNNLNVFSDSSDPWRLMKYKSITKRKLFVLQQKYNIRKKDDWYRIRLKDSPNLIKFLKRAHSDQIWRPVNNKDKSKKAKQWLLTVIIQKRYPNDYIIENYHHPKLTSPNRKLELDLFIPSMNVALEYQGEQHFDDIPGCFSPIDMYKERDTLKIELCNTMQIKLISIPYWWDSSPHSIHWDSLLP